MKTVMSFEYEGTEYHVTPRVITRDFIKNQTHLSIFKEEAGKPETRRSFEIVVQGINSSIADLMKDNWTTLVMDKKPVHPYTILPEWKVKQV